MAYGREGREDDELVEAVEKLGPEAVRELRLDELLQPERGRARRRRACAALVRRREIEPRLLAAVDDLGVDVVVVGLDGLLEDRLRADVRRHDEHRVREVDGPRLGVGEPAVLEDLQHARHRAEDEHAVAVGLQPAEQLVEHGQLARVLDEVLALDPRRARLGPLEEVRVVAHLRDTWRRAVSDTWAALPRGDVSR